MTEERVDYARLLNAAKALINDVMRRYPGEELRCPLMVELHAATQVAAGGFFANLTPEQQAAALAEREVDL